ncbi:acyltransferase [Subtercola sp. PAMC28395]|uniref:acyltransferase family protein n=1 Tax=Subtercola sp. PAMC28395 TaxID=2846775 RepID=UPI001C0D869A|nr:acyltransferase [Subtercola sp. PAMC28395]QWT24929.1 acyltransferase [Subtercola sp. PAMC28395]
MSDRPEIRALTGLRIIAALWVVFFHFNGQFVELIPELSGLSFLCNTGYLAVDLFFVLSGFILAYQYLGEFEAGQGDYRHFLVRRLARIYPMMFVTTAVLIVIVFVDQPDYPDFYSVSGALDDLTLTRGWFVPSEGWNYPAWSLSSEWLAYLLFPLVVAMVLRVARISREWLLILLVMLLGAEVAGSVFLGGADGMPAPDVRVLVAFTAGVAMFLFRDLLPKGRAAGTIATVSLVALIACTGLIPSGPGRAAVGLALCIMVVGFLSTASGPIMRVLGSRLMVFGGRISFAVYMVHGLLYLWLPLAKWYGSPLLERLAIAASVFGLLFTIAIFAHYSIERPAQAWVMKMWARLRARKKAPQPVP